MQKSYTPHVWTYAVLTLPHNFHSQVDEQLLLNAERWLSVGPKGIQGYMRVTFISPFLAQHVSC